MNFTVHLDTGSGGPQASPVRTLMLTGELDHGSAPHLRRALETVYAERCRHLVIDLTGLAFCDSTGISVLLDARAALAGHQGVLVLAGVRPRIERILRLTGLAHAFPSYPTAEQARAALPGSP